VIADSPDPAAARGSESGGGRARGANRERRVADRDPGRSPSGSPAAERERVRADVAALAAEPDAGGGAGGGDSTARYAFGGLGVLAGALAGGFVWYRRRLGR